VLSGSSSAEAAAQQRHVTALGLQAAGDYLGSVKQLSHALHLCPWLTQVRRLYKGILIGGFVEQCCFWKASMSAIDPVRHHCSLCSFGVQICVALAGCLVRAAPERASSASRLLAAQAVEDLVLHPAGMLLMSLRHTTVWIFFVIVVCVAARIIIM